MTMADEIEKLVSRKSGLTEMDIARMLFGRTAYQQRVNSICRQLIKERRVVRRGDGGPGDPFTYHLRPILRRV